jgi:hypothetical protein
VKVRNKIFAKRIGWIVAGALLLGGIDRSGWAQSIEIDRPRDASSIWEGEVGSGFRKNTVEAGFWLGAGIGNTSLGSLQAHDFVLSSVRAGWMFTGVVAPDKWYGGNGELLTELLGGAQINPETRYLVGLTPLMRYNLATGSPWVPFVTCGAGLALTDIGHPDLSGTFQFNPQGGFGSHYFFQKNVAATVEVRMMHISNGGTSSPNHGVNTLLFQAGLSWFF